jgi:hypothetical protein
MLYCNFSFASSEQLAHLEIKRVDVLFLVFIHSSYTLSIMKACVVTLVLSLVTCSALAGCPFAEQAAADREAGVSRKLQKKGNNVKGKPASTTKPTTAPPTPAPAATLKPTAASTTITATSTPTPATTAPASTTPVVTEPATGGSTAPKDCSVKRKFDLVGIYSSVAQVH